LKSRKPVAAPMKAAVPRAIAEEERAGQGRDAGRQAVDVVEQVDRVGDADDPHEAEREIEGRDAGDAQDREQRQEDRRRPHLQHELGGRTERRQIVGHADAVHDAGEQHERQELGVKSAEAEDPEHRQEHGGAADVRHRRGVPAIVRRMGEQFVLPGDARHDGYEHHRQKERRDRNEQQRHRGLGTRECPLLSIGPRQRRR
jgi:hypothetical protein